LQSGPDYTRLSDFDLVDLFERLDPRWSSVQCAQIKEILVARGFLVKDGDLGPGITAPSPAKLETLVGSRTAVTYPARFDQNEGPFRVLASAQNDLRLVGSGMLRCDGVFLRLSSSRFPSSWRLLNSPFRRTVDLRVDRIWNVETENSIIHLDSRSAEALTETVTIWLADDASAARIAALLPKDKAPDFQPRLRRRLEFAQELIARAPATPVTAGLVLLNLLAFIVTFAAGAEWFIPTGKVQIAFGSNFGPYTTDGEWWRLVTSLFLNCGVIYLLVNMVALGSFGPLAERLFGQLNYLLIYLAAGVVGGLAGVAVRPDANVAGASGAIMGVIGALVAVALRGRRSYPIRILRPIRRAALIFTILVFVFGLFHRGIDNLANLGGLVTGFLLGLVFYRRADDRQQSPFRRAIRYLLGGVIFASLVVLGYMGAQRSAKKLTGEGLYWQTTHSLQKRKISVDAAISADLAAAKADPRKLPTLLSHLESVALPFWNDAVARMEGIQLPQTSPNKSDLDDVREFAHERRDTIQRVIAGLRTDDPGQVAIAETQLQDQYVSR
jgi:membrane associated rhomboid family serine protease